MTRTLACASLIAVAARPGFNAFMDLPLPTNSPTAPPPNAAPAPFVVSRPKVQTTPLVFASAHSGRSYTAGFIAAVRLDPVSLRRSEDSFVDDLFAAAPQHGAPLLAATFPRAFCDPNREPWELDPAMFEGTLPAWVNTTSPRVGAGLGTIARVVASGESIYRGKLDFAEAAGRVRTLWQPFHDALHELVQATRQSFGSCLLIDCHSMPGAVQQSRASADVVLGDAHGTSCSPRTMRQVEHTLEELGYRVRRNDPYAGGFITRHYGRPREGIEAVQLELCRSLYMDEVRIEKLPQFAAVQQDMTALISDLAALR